MKWSMNTTTFWMFYQHSVCYDGAGGYWNTEITLHVWACHSSFREGRGYINTCFIQRSLGGVKGAGKKRWWGRDGCGSSGIRRLDTLMVFREKMIECVFHGRHGAMLDVVELN